MKVLENLAAGLKDVSVTKDNEVFTFGYIPYARVTSVLGTDYKAIRVRFAIMDKLTQKKQIVQMTTVFIKESLFKRLWKEIVPLNLIDDGKRFIVVEKPLGDYILEKL